MPVLTLLTFCPPLPRERMACISTALGLIKVFFGIHLRFDIKGSNLTDENKDKLLELNDVRLSKEGVIVIKAEGHKFESLTIL